MLPAANQDLFKVEKCAHINKGKTNLIGALLGQKALKCVHYAVIFCFSPLPPSSPILSDMVKLTKAKTFQAYLDSCHRRYSCVHCRAHLANHDDLISKVSSTLTVVCIITNVHGTS